MSTEGIKKKIVIKKPGEALPDSEFFGGGPQGPTAEEAEAEAIAAAEAQTAEIEFKGEVFEQYYNPLYIEANEGRLEEIAQEPLEITAGEARLSKEDLGTREQLRQQGAEALARQIYHLAQIRRETGLDFYLSAIQETIGEESCEEAKERLDRANAFFSSYYEMLIKERGERPEIFAQVTKRAGHANEERVFRIVTGYDIRADAKKLFEISFDELPDKQNRIREILIQCTEKEVRALRREFTRIPIRELATQLNDIVKAPLDSKQVSESADYWQRVNQARAEQASRVKATLRYDYERLAYLLRGRTAEETEQLLYQYDVLFAGDDLRVQNMFLSDLKARLGDRAKEIETLARGFDPDRSVEAINALINTSDLTGLHEGDMLGSLDDVEDPPKLGPRYLGTFRKRRACRNLDGLFDPVLDTRPGVIALVEYMSAEEFEFVNGLLNERYGFTLEADNYPVAGHFDARQRALALIESMVTRDRLYYVVRPLAYLNPLQCLEVSRAYSCITGRNLKADMTACLAALYSTSTPPTPPEGVVRLLNNRVEGRSRWPLTVDLLERFRGEGLERNGSLGAWDIDEVATSEAEAGALRIAEIINDQGLSPEEKGSQVLEFVGSKSYTELNGIEHAFFQLSDPSEPLLGLLLGCLPEQHYAELALLFSGYDVRSLVSNISEDLGTVYILRNAPVEAVSLARGIYEQLTGRSLIIDIKQALPDRENFDELVDLLSILYMPEAFEFMRLLRRLSVDQHGSLRQLKRLWQKEVVDTLSLERACDYRYGRLRLQMKSYATRGLLPTEDFIDCILHFEGVSPDVCQILLRCINDNDVVSIKQILRENHEDQPTIEECCDLLLVDSLRRTLLGMKADTDAINELILHLDAYYPPEVAHELYEAIEASQGEELAEAILAALRDPTPDDWNSRIPNDPNWSGEMLNQIRVAFESQYNVSLLSRLRVCGVGPDAVLRITERVFGSEPTKIAVDLYNLMRNEIDESPEQKQNWIKVIEEIAIRGARSRQRILDVYRQYFTTARGEGDLIGDVQRYVLDEENKKKILELMKLEPAQETKAQEG